MFDARRPTMMSSGMFIAPFDSGVRITHAFSPNSPLIYLVPPDRHTTGGGGRCVEAQELGGAPRGDE
jgi:hypothetical protein